MRNKVDGIDRSRAIAVLVEYEKGFGLNLESEDLEIRRIEIGDRRIHVRWGFLDEDRDFLATIPIGFWLLNQSEAGATRWRSQIAVPLVK